MAYLPITHKNTQSGVQDYVKMLASFYRDMPSAQGTGRRAQGVVMRTRLPNQGSTKVRHPSGRPPAEHIVRMLAKQVTAVHYKPHTTPDVHVKIPTVHPGKALALKQIKSIHLGKPSIKKVTA